MKNIAIAFLLAMGLTATAQVNQNVTKESTTTTVTVNNGAKPRTITKTETTEAKQNIELKDANSKKLNKDVKDSPVEVSSSTTIQGDGIPSYYEMNGQRYVFVTDKSGYKIASPTVRNYGVVRKTANGNYIYRTANSTSVGHFDETGNFVVETYDDKTDGVTVETYTKVINP